MSEHDPGTDLARRAVEEAAPEVSRFIGTIFGSANMQLDGMLGDRVGWWRLKQAVKLTAKAQKLIDNAGLEAHQIPLRTSLPLLEAASLEEEDDLCDRWAALLANAAATPASVPPGFPSVLRELEPEAARVLDIIYNDYMGVHEDFRDEFSIFLEEHEKPANFRYHVDNLQRLGLVRSWNFAEQDERYQQLIMTAFGAAFVRACRPPGTADPPLKWVNREELKRYISERDAQPVPAMPPDRISAE
jgi:hypothetical protein